MVLKIPLYIPLVCFFLGFYIPEVCKVFLNSVININKIFWRKNLCCRLLKLN